MSVLISYVGDSDPIRNLHDGAILHIARIKRPDKIVLLHSARSINKHQEIVKAINSIESTYSPQIIKESKIIPNDEVFLFDDMYGHIHSKIKEHQDNNEITMLNLTSGTPQMIAGLFAIVQINELNVEAYQVTTPTRDSNEGVLHDTQEDIETLIELNEDNQENYAHRLLQVGSENFNRSLMQRTFRDLINVYEFLGAYNLVKQNQFINKQGILIGKLKSITDAIKYQKLLPNIEDSPLKINYTNSRLINAYVIIDIQAERNLVSEVLIRVKNFAETIAVSYLKKIRPEILRRENGRYYLDPSSTLIKEVEKEYKNETSYSLDLSRELSFKVYRIILKVLSSNDNFYNALLKIEESITERNTVAHSLDEIDEKKVDLKNLVNMCKKLLEELEPKSGKLLYLKDSIKKDLLSYLD